MFDPATAPERRRAPLGPVVALAAYLLLCPAILVLAPLLGLLLLSRPTTGREWWWTFGIIAWLGLVFAQAGGIATQIVLAWGVFLAGAFVAIQVWRPRPWLPAAIAGTALALGAVTAMGRLVGIGWSEIRLAVIHDGWELCRQLLDEDGIGTRLSPERTAALRTYVDAFSDSVGLVAALYPALLALAGVLGIGMAWRWYHRIALRPIGPMPTAFAAFRFNDQLIWGVVAVALLLVLPLPEPSRVVGANLALFLGGLYAARGAAVAWATASAIPAGFLLALLIGLLFLFPLALGGLVSLGLADTWIDFRRRPAPSH